MKSVTQLGDNLQSEEIFMNDNSKQRYSVSVCVDSFVWVNIKKDTEDTRVSFNLNIEWM